VDSQKGLGEHHSISALMPKLQALASDGNKPVEFIVANTHSGSQLIRIRRSEIEYGLQAAWIGDQNAFERFQRERSKTPDNGHLFIERHLSPGARVMSTLQRAMQATIDDLTIKSVGEFCVSVAATARGFEYLGSVFIYVGRDIRVQAGDDLLSKMAHPIEEGGYAVSVVEPSEAGTPALGLSFPRARLAKLFLPLKFESAQVIGDVSPKEFAKVVFERFGVAMKDPPLR
jgi:hypothetical protein